jgi:hypothetical protein
MLFLATAARGARQINMTDRRERATDAKRLGLGRLSRCAALVTLGLTALAGCGPALISRGNGIWPRSASVVAYPLTIVDESLDPPMTGGDRADFQSSYDVSFEQAVSRIVIRHCSESRSCLHVRVTVRLRQDNAVDKQPNGTWTTTPRILAEAEVSLSDAGGRLIELVQINARSSGQLGFEVGRYIAARLRRAS